MERNLLGDNVALIAAHERHDDAWRSRSPEKQWKTCYCPLATL